MAPRTEGGPLQVIAARVSATEAEGLARAAAAEGVSRSTLLRQMLAERLEANPPRT